MKIIREHHGFTTNSSASSEWVDLAEKYQQLALQQAAEQAAKNDENAADEQSDDPASHQDKEAAKQPAAPVIPEAPSAPPNPFMSNLATLSLIVLSVLGIFAIERGLHRYLKQRKAASDDV